MNTGRGRAAGRRGAGGGRSRGRLRRVVPALPLILLLLAGTVGGCGFRPIYGPEPVAAAAAAEEEDAVTTARPVRADLAAVRIVAVDSRLGQVLRNDLLDALNPAGLDLPPAYDLVVRTSRGTQALAIQLDNQVTRYNLTLAAAFQLRRRADGRPLYRGVVRRIASYNVRREPFATLIAEQDAERRAAREISQDITTQLAVLFAGGFEEEAAAAAPPPPQPLQPEPPSPPVPPVPEPATTGGAAP